MELKILNKIEALEGRLVHWLRRLDESVYFSYISFSLKLLTFLSSHSDISVTKESLYKRNCLFFFSLSLFIQNWCVVWEEFGQSQKHDRLYYSVSASGARKCGKHSSGRRPRQRSLVLELNCVHQLTDSHSRQNSLFICFVPGRFASCCDLLLSRFSYSDFKVYGIAGIKINRVIRIHNSALRLRFEDKLHSLFFSEEPASLSQCVKI